MSLKRNKTISMYFYNILFKKFRIQEGKQLAKLGQPITDYDKAASFFLVLVIYLCYWKFYLTLLKQTNICCQDTL